MATSILPFAESLTHKNDDNYYSWNTLSNDEAFPPLSSTIADFEIIRDDVLFTGDNSVWVNTRTYAEAAENAGVDETPISICNTYNLQPGTHKQYKYTPKPRDIVDDYDDDNYADSFYYDFKAISTDKASAENTVQARKLKAAEYRCQRDLQRNLRKLPDTCDDMTPEDAKAVREARELVDGCTKIMNYREPDETRYSRNDRARNKFKVKDWHSIWRRCVLRAFNNDPIIVRLYDEFEAHTEQHNLPLFRGGPNRLRSTNWNDYHRMKFIVFRRIRQSYSDFISSTEGVDPSLTRKERLWLIRSAIPEKKYIDPKATRTNCAYTILNDIDGFNELDS